MVRWKGGHCPKCGRPITQKIGEPVRPCPDCTATDNEAVAHGACSGLTKREHFAAMAMQGLMHRVSRGYSIADLAELSVVAADVLLAELGKEDSQ